MEATSSAPEQGRDPIVVSFPSGLPPSLLEGDQGASSSTPNTTNLPSFTWTRRRANSSRGKIVLGLDEACAYSASSEGRGHDGRQTKLFLAIYDRKTSSLKLVPAAKKDTVFALQQSVPTCDETSTGAVSTQNMSYAEKNNLLYESFGSKKKRKATQSRAVNVVKMDSVFGSEGGMMHALDKQLEDTSESNVKAMQRVREKGLDHKVSSLASLMIIYYGYC